MFFDVAITYNTCVLLICAFLPTLGLEEVAEEEEEEAEEEEEGEEEKKMRLRSLKISEFKDNKVANITEIDRIKYQEPRILLGVIRRAVTASK